MNIDKKTLSEAETRAKLIDPAMHARGWTEDLIRREEKVGKFKIPIPTLDIQKEIIANMESKLVFAKELSNMLESQLAEINRLPASLLQEAFAGQG